MRTQNVVIYTIIEKLVLQTDYDLIRAFHKIFEKIIVLKPELHRTSRTLVVNVELLTAIWSGL